VRDNIVLGAPHADDAAVLRAADVAGVTEFVNRSASGFDLRVGERGEGLSGGQRQAIAIARAELLSPPVLLLDEPSSAMDNRSEEQFKALLAAQLGGRTLILISHRASLLTLVNRLIVIDQGRVIADGPKDQVLTALAGGKLSVTSR
jgi:ATP-binding cassette subfamily C protein LapB